METRVNAARLPAPFCDSLEGMDSYDDRWQELKRRRNLALFAFIGYVPITVGFVLLTHNFLQSDKAAFAFAIAWILFAMVASLRHSMFPCPRCGKWFFSTWLYHNGFARRCVHCKLPIYSAKETAGP
jgi:hypothetical protein